MELKISNTDLAKTITIKVLGSCESKDFTKGKRYLIPVGDGHDIGFYVGYNSFTGRHIFECWNPKNGRLAFSNISQIKNIE